MFLRFFLFSVIFSLSMWYLHEFHTAQFIQVTRNIPFLSPMMVQLHNWLGPTKTVKKVNTGNFKEKLFTKEQLMLYDGNHGKGICIAILGKVYDVNAGEKHYVQSGTYFTFAGRDNSRAFITGDFDLDSSSDDVLDLPLSDLLSLVNWAEFYEKDYVYQGKLIGRYYTATGEKTDYCRVLEKKIEEAKDAKNLKEKDRRKFPPCNVEWTAEKGSRVWCTSKSGGVTRNWAGVPRKLYEVGSDGYHCVCINLPELEIPDSPQYPMRHNLAGYEDCEPNSTSCYYQS